MKTKIFHRWTGLMVLCASSLALSAQMTTTGLSGTEPPNARPLPAFDVGDTEGFSSLGLAPLWGGIDEALSVPLAPAAGRTIQVDPTYRPAQLRFERNEGQFDSEVQFLARGAGCHLFLTRDEAVMVLFRATQREAEDDGRWPGSADFESAVARISNPPAPRTSHGLPTGSRRHSRLETCATSSGFLDHVREPSVGRAVLRMRLAGASLSAPVRGENELRGKVNYFLGNDPARWRTNIATYGQVRFQGVYPGIDLVYYGNQGQLEYDFVVAPGADPNSIALAFEGAQGLGVDAQGDLVLNLGEETLRWRPPKVYQLINGHRRGVAGNYVLDGAFTDHGSRITHHASRITHHVSFSLASYDRSKPLVIDPVLLYSTYLGGSAGADAEGVAADPQGNAYLTGSTRSTDFPITNAFQGPAGNIDAFVTKLSPDGQLVYSTYLGGTGDETATGIAVDPRGGAYVIGQSDSSDFPLVNPLLLKSLEYESYLVKLTPEGSALEYATFLGARASAVAVDQTGSACVVGGTGSGLSPNFPIKNALQPQPSSDSDAYIMKFDPTGTNLIYSTFFGGGTNDAFSGVALDRAGCAYVAGTTRSGRFPVKNAIQPRLAGGIDGVFAKLSADGSELLFSSYIGGSGDESFLSIALGPDGDLYLGGDTASANFPVVHPFQATRPGAANAFLARIKSDGSKTVFATYFGGSSKEFVMPGGAAVDPAGNFYFAGFTQSRDLPLVHPLQSTLTAPVSAGFVATLSQDGSQLLFSTYWGGSGNDMVKGVALDATGNVYLAGITSSTDLPVTNAIQSTLNGTSDAFITRLSPAAPLAPPSLRVLRSGVFVDIIWPSTAAGFVLESTDSLAAANWSAVAESPELQDGENVVILGATNAARFFRLAHQ